MDEEVTVRFQPHFSMLLQSKCRARMNIYLSLFRTENRGHSQQLKQINAYLGPNFGDSLETTIRKCVETRVHTILVK